MGKFATASRTEQFVPASLSSLSTGLTDIVPPLGFNHESTRIDFSEHDASTPLRCGDALFWTMHESGCQAELFIQNSASLQVWRAAVPADLGVFVFPPQTADTLPRGDYRFWMRLHAPDGTETVGPFQFRFEATSETHGNPAGKPQRLLDRLKRGARKTLHALRKGAEAPHIQVELHKRARSIIKDDLRQGRTRLRGLPLGVNVAFVGRGCNINCSMCSFPSIVNKSAFGDFYKRVSESLKPVIGNFSLIQSAGAEPLMYPELKDLLEQGRNWPRLKFCIGTNGVLIDDAWASALCGANVSKLSVSIDAASEETYREIRRNSDWSKVMRGLELIKEHRQGKSPRVLLNFIIFKCNLHEIEDFVEMAHRVGAAEVVYQTPLRVFDERSVVHGDKNKTSKLEWTYNNESFRDPYTAGEALWRLARARKLAEGYGIKVPYTNVPNYFLTRHPYLQGIEAALDLEAMKDFVAAAIKDRNDVYRPVSMVAADEDFGTDPARISWINTDDYTSLEAWFVNLDPRVPGNNSIRVPALDADTSSIALDGVESSAEGIHFPLANGDYDVFFVMKKDDDYSITPRRRLKITQSRAKWPARPPAVAGPRMTMDQYADVPDVVPPEEIKTKDFFCTHPFVNMTVRDGTFSFCCWSIARYRAMPVEGETLNDIWNSKPIREARYHMLRGEGREKVCRDICPHYKTGFRASDVGGEGFEV